MISVSNISYIFISFVLLGPYTSKADSSSIRPNIVLIVVDDAALMDFGAYGGEAHTPNIDQLAHGGVMFTHYRTSPSCAPSRAMLLTGCDSHLTGVPNLPEFLSEEHTVYPGYQGILNDKVVTVASRLKDTGYRTYITGKWHLGNTPTTLPNARGFDRSYILGASGADNYEQKSYLPMKDDAPWYEDGQPTTLPDDFYSSKDYVDKMISYLDQDREKDSPFFSYLAFQAIHIPVQAPKEYVEKYQGLYDEGWAQMRVKRFGKAQELGIIPKDAPLGDMLSVLRDWDKLSYEAKKEASDDMAVNAAMLESMDFHIGRFVQYLKEKKQLDHTVFIITSDNGPEGSTSGDSRYMDYWMWQNDYHRDPNRLGEKGYYGFIGPEFASAAASPHAFFKFYTGEGGIRVPLIISGHNIPKGQREDAFTFVTDITPTILDMAQIEQENSSLRVPMIGRSLYPLLQNQVDKIYREDEPIGLEVAGQSALFLGKYKIVKNGKPYGDGLWHLYDLAQDPGETTDLSKELPIQFATMVKHYVDYAEKNQVLEMGVDYETAKQLEYKTKAKLKNQIKPWLLSIIVLLIGLYIYKKVKPKSV